MELGRAKTSFHNLLNFVEPVGDDMYSRMEGVSLPENTCIHEWKEYHYRKTHDEPTVVCFNLAVLTGIRTAVPMSPAGVLSFPIPIVLVVLSN
jgi:hypothetical protein